MKIRLGQLRSLVREALEATVLYHGTLAEYAPSIARTGLRAGEGWGGAAKPGVFLSANVEDAMHWAKMTALKKMKLPQEESYFNQVDEADLAVVKVTIPESERHNVIPRQRSYNLPGDMQFVGSVPPEWITIV